MFVYVSVSALAPTSAAVAWRGGFGGQICGRHFEGVVDNICHVDRGTVGGREGGMPPLEMAASVMLARAAHVVFYAIPNDTMVSMESKTSGSAC